MFRRILKEKRIRSHTRWFLLFLVAVLIVPLVLFFHSTAAPSRRGPGGIAGELFGRRIPWETFEQEYRLMEQDLASRFGGSLPEGFEPFVRRQTWDRLIVREAAARRRIRISDEALAAHIRSLPIFQEQGVFSPQRYDAIVRRMGASPRDVEERLREELRVQRMLEAENAGIAVSDEEVRAAYEERHRQVRTTVVLVRDADAQAVVEPTLTEPRLLEWYAGHLSDFQQPARLPPFEEVREEVRRRLLAQEAHAASGARARQWREEVTALQQGGVSFEEACRRLDLSPIRPAPFSRSGPIESVGPMPPGAEALFARHLGEASEVFEVPSGFFFAAVEEQLPVDDAKFAEEKTRFREDTLSAKQAEHTSAWLTALRAQARLKDYTQQTP